MKKVAWSFAILFGFSLSVVSCAKAALLRTVLPAVRNLTPVSTSTTNTSNSDNIKTLATSTSATQPATSATHADSQYNFSGTSAASVNNSSENQSGNTNQTINIQQKVQMHNANLGFPVALSEDIGAELSVCDIGSYCSGDMGSLHWEKDAAVTVGDMKRGLSWYTNDNQVKDGLLEISLMPFDSSWPSKAIYSQNVSIGTSVFNFQTLSKPSSYSVPKVSTVQASAQASDKYAAANKPLVQGGGVKAFFSNIWQKAKNIFQAPFNFIGNLLKGNAITGNKINLDIKPIYYLRVIPLINGKIAGAPTNQVTVKMVDPPGGFTFYTPPKIYEIKIKEFQPLLAPDKGVCTHRMILDTDAYMPKAGGIGYELKKAGDTICPAPFMGIGEKAWYEQLWDGLKSGLSWVSKAYSDLKSAVVDVVGSVACAGDSTCKEALSAGLDIGLTALGIPPTIPDFSQLSDQGLGYLASEISSQVGCPDAVCTSLIKDNLKKAIDQSGAGGIGGGCMDTNAAHDMGIEPVCLVPASAKAHWDPAATYRDAKVTLQVYRNYVDDPNDNSTSTNYRIDLSNQGYNAGPVGGWILNIEPDDEKMQINQPLQGELFDYKSLPLPHMQKGQTMDIPINLVASEYWVPGHKELMHGWSTVIYHDGWPQYQYDDWWLFYYGANLSFSARVNGCPYGGDDNSCVISSDVFNTALPMTLNP